MSTTNPNVPPTRSSDIRHSPLEAPSSGMMIAIFVFVVAVIGSFIVLRPMSRQPGYVEVVAARQLATTNSTAPTTMDAVGQPSPQVEPTPQATPAR
jgi:hypothetical protein